MSLRSRLYSLARRLFSWASRGKELLKKIVAAIAARKYLLIMLSGAVVAAAGSIWLHLLQAEKLGEARETCNLRFATYQLRKEQETQRLIAEVEMQAQAELSRIRKERDVVSQDLQALRQAFDDTVSAFDRELEDLARQQPEIVPWLDTPVPPSLLQD